MRSIIIGTLALLLAACNPTSATYPDVRVAGAMHNVMWKGELGGVIRLDTIQNKTGLYGLGPEAYLRGELLIDDGKAYVSRVLTDSTMTVEETFAVAAPFFVYANVEEWETLDLPSDINNLAELEAFIDARTKDTKRPFAFKLQGTVEKADIHIQNLPPGTTVSSPAEAHQGQINYLLENEEATLIGFFSTSHQGVFTHHDTYLHLHLITADRQKMGHLDAVNLGEMRLFLPKRKP